MQIKLINDSTPDMLNNMRRQILAKIEGAKNYLQAQEEEKPQDNVKKVKHKLQDNEELVEYLFVDGKRKKKVIRHERKKKGLTKEEASEILKVFSLFDKDGSESIDSYPKSQLNICWQPVGFCVCRCFYCECINFKQIND